MNDKAPSETETAFDRETFEFYGLNADAYVGVRPDAASTYLATFLKNLAPGARILELGCGGGRDAAEMQRLGFQVDATDGSPAMAAIASNRLSRPVPTLRFDQLEAVQAYDAIVANAALLHVPRAALPAVLRRIWTALKPGGWHYASYKTNGSEGYDALRRYYNYPGARDAAMAYQAAGSWASLAYDEFDGEGYFNVPARWLAVTAQK